MPKRQVTPYPLSLSADERSDMTEALLAFADASARDLPWRHDITPYRVWVSEIMLQQTRAEVVRRYFDRFLEALPTPKALAEASPDHLAKLWEGLGYYRRARLMQRAAQIICKVYGGEIPADYEKLRALPGFGEYTAGAVASFAFGLRAPAVDGNLLRVLARLVSCEDNVLNAACADRLRALARTLLPPPVAGTPAAMTENGAYLFDGYAAASWNQAMMELGAQVCLPNTAPHCSLCPLSPYCRACAEGSAARLPLRESGTKRREEKKTVLRIMCDGRYLLHRRPNEGLLAGLYEFPNTDGYLTADEAKMCAEKMGFAVQEVLYLGRAKHVFTHITWHMEGYELVSLQKDSLPPNTHLVTRAELAEVYSVPGAFRAYHPLSEPIKRKEQST